MGLWAENEIATGKKENIMEIIRKFVLQQPPMTTSYTEIAAKIVIYGQGE